MNNLWWQLSGVSGFVRRSAHWLRTGNNLVCVCRRTCRRSSNGVASNVWKSLATWR